ncbi:hypothetical protein CMUS01_08023 [Colletotrichum musicola]|uniref:GPI inositol-deacylase winged helix domain-containing protein n=1 Tax=Colletotrichum musicola TaxID=2175873 RepID=A0A8H6KDQ3_9PEZI|nr:hypothetical protein CMUS01_08023 [Colletotrichum musicola]
MPTVDFFQNEILHTSFKSLDTSAGIVPAENGFSQTIIRAFQQDLHLTLRPDNVWLAILVQVSFFIGNEKRAEERFEGFPHLEVSATDEDVRLYLEGNMDQLQNTIYRNPALREEIKDSIANSIDGIVKAIRTTIENLSTGTDSYEVAYQDAMDRIKPQGRDQAELAMQALSWLVCTRRTLSPAELQHALAVEVGKTALDRTNISEVEDILSVCAGLVVSDPKSDVITLVHYTAQEYLERTRTRWFPSAETDITMRCLTYLLLDTFGSGSCETTCKSPPTARETPFADFKLPHNAFGTPFDRLDRYPLYNHAATYWEEYFKAGDKSTRDIVLRFLQSAPHVQAAREGRGKTGFISRYTGPKFLRRLRPGLTGLTTNITGAHLPAYLGLTELLRALHELGHSVATTDCQGRAPISYAALMGHEKTVRLLAGLPGVDVNVVDNQDRTPLLSALSNGRLSTVNALMSLETVAKDRKELLLCLAERDRLSGFNILTCNGKMDSELLSTGLGHKVLSVAAQCGSKNILKSLIERGDIELDARDEEGRSPIMLAALNENVTAVEALLFSGRLHPNQDVGNGQTPLSFIAENDKRSLFQLASRHTTSYTRKMRAYCRLGSVITETGNVADFRYLLEFFKGIDINEKNPLTGRTYVSLAAECGRADIVKMLVLSRGADFQSRDSTGQTPLGLAILGRHSEVFEFLFGQIHPGKRCHKMSPKNSA